MKYKILLTGNNRTTINEFFTQMDVSFECMTTSSRYDDILSHVKYMEPDAFVYCLSGEKTDDLKRFITAERMIFREKFPIFVIGDSEDCDMFVKAAPLMKVTILQKPIFSRIIEETIVKLLDEKRTLQEKKQEETMAEAVQSVEDSTVEKVAEKEQENRKRHILVVDDDSNVLKLIKRYLADKYDVATAISGKVAIKFLETRETDLVLLDYEMPGENGPAVLSKIRGNEKTENLPVVFLTGVTDREKIHEVLEMKPQGYLLKPINMERLLSTIKGILK